MTGHSENLEINVFADTTGHKSFLDEVLEELIRQRRLDFTNYNRKALERRLQVYLGHSDTLDNPTEYLDRLHCYPDELDRLIDALTVPVSYFFRNSMVWEILAYRVLPELIRKKSDTDNSNIRIWSAGCSTGEEAYSLAVLLHEVLKKKSLLQSSHIFATDISKKALETAQTGYYPREKFEHIKLGLLDKYFTPENLGYQVSPQLREIISFSYDDLTSKDRIAPAESVFGSFDVVLCRNVLIYFEVELQRQVLSKLVGSLVPGGWLILGDTEFPGLVFRDHLTTVDYTNRIFRRRQRP